MCAQPIQRGITPSAIALRSGGTADALAGAERPGEQTAGAGWAGAKVGVAAPHAPPRRPARFLRLRLSLVQFHQSYGVYGAAVDAEPAEDALVLALGNDLRCAAVGTDEDVHRAGRDALPALGLAGAEGRHDHRADENAARP